MPTAGRAGAPGQDRRVGTGAPEPRAAGAVNRLLPLRAVNRSSLTRDSD